MTEQIHVEVVGSGLGVVTLEPAPVDVRLPFSTSSVSAARRRLEGWMSQCGTPATAIDDARLLISELVGNAVRHAQPLPDGSLLVHWTLGSEGLEVSVTDGGSRSAPHRIHASPAALSGRGMAIVETLAASWWMERSSSQSSVHVLLPLE